MLPYVKMSQSPYPPLAELPFFNLTSMSKTMAEELACAPSLIDFIASRQQSTLGVLLEEFQHPATALLQNYV